MSFLTEFEERYLTWAAAEMKPKLDTELAAFKHSHLKFEFFFLFGSQVLTISDSCF